MPAPLMVGTGRCIQCSGPVMAGAEPDPFAPSDIPDLEVWLEADVLAATLNNGDPVATWTDQSTHARNATQGTSSQRPSWVTNVANGQPVVRFDGTDDFVEWPSGAFSGFAVAEVFLVVRIVADPPTPTDATSGLWRMNLGALSHYPYTDGVVYDSFATSARKTTGNPTLSLADWRLYNVVSASGEWTSRIDGVQHYTTASNTVSWDNSPYLGMSSPSYRLKGDVAAFLLFSRKLTTYERADLEAYLAAKYGLSL